MDTEARIAALQQKHRELENTIDQELQHPNFDSLQLTELKRQKLRIKDEISRLEHDAVH